jgi:restriction endonuclease
VEARRQPGLHVSSTPLGDNSSLMAPQKRPTWFKGFIEGAGWIVLLLLLILSVIALGTVGVANGIRVAFVLAVLVPIVIWRYRRYSLRRSFALVQLEALSPSRFHAAILDLLREFGYHEIQEGHATPGWQDFHCLDRAGRSTFVRCQRPPRGRFLRSRDIKRFDRESRHAPERRMLVTTAHCTVRAHQLAKSGHIRLIDGLKLSRLTADVHAHRDEGRRIPMWDRLEL